MCYVQAKVIEYTDQGMIVVPRRPLIRRVFTKKSDTLFIAFDTVIAINKTSGLELLGTAALSQAVARISAIVALL